MTLYFIQYTDGTTGFIKADTKIEAELMADKPVREIWEAEEI